MNDDLPTSDADLASAALDNEVTADERARVTGSPELTGEVDFYESLRGRLADVVVPAASRESAIAAALAVFDSIGTAEVDEEPTVPASDPPASDEPGHDAGAAVTGNRTSNNVISIHERRTRQYRWLGGAAAAAAVVAFIAVGALSLSTGSTDESAMFTTAESTELKSVLPPADAATQAQPIDSTMAADAELGEGVAEASGPTEMDSNDAATSGPTETTAAATAPQQFSVDVELSTPGEVLAYVNEGLLPPQPILSSTAETTAATTANSEAAADTTAAEEQPATTRACSTLTLGRSLPVVYQGARALLVDDRVAEVVLVVDPSSCDVLDTIPNPVAP